MTGAAPMRDPGPPTPPGPPTHLPRGGHFPPPRGGLRAESASSRDAQGRNAVAAIVIAGGRASRLGRDKATLMLGGRTLVERTRDAAQAAGFAPVIVVGPHIGGGPVAAIADGLRQLAALGTGRPDWVAVLPTDLAWPEAAILHLSTQGDDSTGDGAILLDEDGREQWLTAIYSTAALGRALAELGDPIGAPVRTLVGGLRLARIPAGADAADIDTWEDYDRVRHLAP